MGKALGLVFGIAFLLGGVLGFVPGVTKDGMYFGIFMVNTAHNLLHIASGTIFLIAFLLGTGATRLGFRIFGVIYAAIAVIGFKVGDGVIFGVISNNRYDALGHALLATGMLLIGFAAKREISAA